MRLAQTQVWPALRYFEAIAPLTAISISASSNTMNGALPPNSIEVFLRRRTLLHQQLADFGRAGEGQFAHGRVRGQFAADFAIHRFFQNTRLAPRKRNYLTM